MVSCSTNEPVDKKIDLPKEAIQSTIPTFRKIPNDSLIHYSYQTEKTTTITNSDFKSLGDFPKNWIGLSKNHIGLFIYHRGKGLADILTIANDTLTNGGYGEAVSWPIREFKKMNNGKYFLGLGLDTISSTYARSTIEILENDTLFSIQSTEVFIMEDGKEKLLGQYSGLYIPNEMQHLFYHIDEPNRKDPNSWIPMEEIDLEKFKNKKLVTTKPKLH